MQQYTGNAEMFAATLSGYEASLLPVPGFIKSYRGTHIDDFGNRSMVIIRTTGRADENGNISWTEAVK